MTAFLHVDLPGPIDLPTSLESFRRWGDDFIDRWDGRRLARTVPVRGGTVAYYATVSGSVEKPALEVELEDGDFALDVQAAIQSSFLQQPPEFSALLEQDPVLAALAARFPGLRPVLQLDLLSALIRSISAQQVNLRWAATTRRRLAERFGRPHEVGGEIVYSFDADRLANALVAEIRELQFTTRKAEYIIGVAEEIASDRLVLEELRMLPDEAVIERLSALRGIGRWTAEWLLLRTLGRPTVVAGDLGVRKAVGAAYLGVPLPSEADVRAATAHWGASAAIAQTLLLYGMSQGIT